MHLYMYMYIFLTLFGKKKMPAIRKKIYADRLSDAINCN